MPDKRLAAAKLLMITKPVCTANRLCFVNERADSKTDGVLPGGAGAGKALAGSLSAA
jgi:hypothetical protein